MLRYLDGSAFVPAAREERLVGAKVVVVLEAACVELVHEGAGRHALVAGAQHQKVLRRAGREDLTDLRPDITFQCLKALLESPLNLGGNLLVYIRTQQGLLIEVNPQLAPPRTYNEFQGMLGTCLLKRNLRAKQAHVTLMQVVKNDLDKLIPPGCRRIGLEVSGTPVNLADFVQREFGSAELAPEQVTAHPFAIISDFAVRHSLREQRRAAQKPVVFFIGAVAHGSPVAKAVNADVHEEIAISPHHLTAAECCHRVCHAFEQLWYAA